MLLELLGKILQVPLLNPYWNRWKMVLELRGQFFCISLYKMLVKTNGQCTQSSSGQLLSILFIKSLSKVHGKILEFLESIWSNPDSNLWGMLQIIPGPIPPGFPIKSHQNEQVMLVQLRESFPLYMSVWNSYQKSGEKAPRASWGNSCKFIIKSLLKSMEMLLELLGHFFYMSL